jgi:hypothetical protein
MTTRHFTVPLAGSAHAALVLPQPLTLDAIGQLEEGLARRLAMLRREVEGQADDAGEREYASWMQHLRPSR